MSIIRGLAILLGVSLLSLSAHAQGLRHDWPVTLKAPGGTVLTAEGSAKGRGLTATILDPVTVGGATIPEAFDAGIARRMAAQGAELTRTDLPRIEFMGRWMLQTTIEYEDTARGRRIAFFTAWPQPGATELRIVHADGPDDSALMEHYVSDIIEIAKAPDAAASGTIARIAHGGAAPAAKPSAAPVPAPAASAKPGLSGSAGVPEVAGWTRKPFKGGVAFYPASGALALKSKTGYLSVSVYDPESMSGRGIGGYLDHVIAMQSKDFGSRKSKVLYSESAQTSGDNRATGYMRLENKHGTMLHIAYLAQRTGPDAAMVVREITTSSLGDRKPYRQGRETIYAAGTRLLPAPYRPGDNGAGIVDSVLQTFATESRSQRNARRKRTRDAESARTLASITTPPGQGIPMSDIEGIFLRSDYLERAYGEGNPGFAIYLLLKDGTACNNPTRPPSDLNLQASRREQSDQWLQWRKTGNGYEFRAEKGAAWKRIKGRLAAPAPSRTLDFRGRFIRAWGDVLMGTAGFSEGGITLTRKGRFETSSFTMAGGGGLYDLPAATVAVSKDKNGVRSTTLSNTAPALTNSSQLDPRGNDHTGAYALDGYTAEFLTDSGRLTRTLFFMPNRNSIYLRGKNYSPPKK